MRIALLSNVNTDFIVRQLSQKYDMVPPEGYGNVWERILDQNSNISHADPDVLIFIVDIENLLDSDNVYNQQEAETEIDQWFAMLDTVIRSDHDYFISDVTFRSEIPFDNDSFLEESIGSYWTECLRRRIACHGNVHALKLDPVIHSVGKRSFYSDKLWYIGKMPFTNEGASLHDISIGSILADEWFRKRKTVSYEKFTFE